MRGHKEGLLVYTIGILVEMVVSHVVLVVNKNNNFGLAKDAELLKGAWIAWGRAHGIHGLKVSVLDPREPPVVCDVVVFLEVPHPVWFPWAKVRILMLNEEWWLDAWNGYVKEFDLILCKTKDAAVRLAERTGTLPEQALVHWKGTVTPAEFNLTLGPLKAKEQSWSWFLGGSVNKIAAAKQLLPLWPVSNLPLKVYVTAEFLNAEELAALPENVKVIVGDLSPKQHRIAAAKSVGHVNCSAAESFGYAAAESVAAGAFMLLNRINTYSEYYGDCRQAAWVDLSGSAEEIQKALVEADAHMRVVDLKTLSDAQAKFYEKMDRRWKESFGAFADAVAVKVSAAGDLGQMPPVITPEDCPKISLLTPLKNYGNFVNLGLLNIMLSDYPLDKIEWVICDATNMNHSKGPVILKMGDKIAPAKLVYIPIDKEESTIGELRNMCAKYASNDILLNFDIDDYYPPTSFRRRVSWLLKDPSYNAIFCTDIAGYCLQTGRSFMTVPPYALELSKRVSEATLCFKREFWNKRQFKKTNISEGEDFIEGRENEVCVIPPYHQIVSFIHGSNTSGRYIPENGVSKKPSNAFGFTPAELRFFHGLIGIVVEAA